ncbi:MAG: chorismate synthase [Bdellovibrionales bacterium]
MSANRFGNYFCMTSFGESHGPSMGVVIDGCPSGVQFDETLLREFLGRRRPGQNAIVTERAETDDPLVLSGVFEGQTLGTPIAIIIKNSDAKSDDYQQIKNNPRTGHADDIWLDKFGVADYRGGGRSSGRETVSRVMAGAVAAMFLKQVVPEMEVCAFTSKVHNWGLPANKLSDWIGDKNLLSETRLSEVRCPEVQLSNRIHTELVNAKAEGESYGGVATLVIRHLPKNLGEPVFFKFKNLMTSALMSIGATTGVEVGQGFSSADLKGTEFHSKENSSVYGGIRGGITTGEFVHINIAFKPTSSVMDVAKKGRHDPCIVPRACAVIEAMAYLVLADLVLARRLNKVNFNEI